MGRQRGPDRQVVIVTIESLTLQNCQVGQEEISQGPQQPFANLRRVPLRDNPHHVSPFAQVLGAALEPAAALQFGSEDLREVAANAVAN